MDDWLVSITKDGKVVELYYSDRLEDIETIKALHPGCNVETMRINDSNNNDDSEDESPKKERWVTKRVICIETGERFRSVTSCSESVGVSRWNIYKAIQQGLSVNGKHYNYIKN